MKEEELRKKMQESIQWIRKKVEETGAKGVVIGEIVEEKIAQLY